MTDVMSAEARAWFVRLLDEDVTLDEIAAWESWLARDTAHRAAFEAVRDAWGVGGHVSVPRSAIRELAADRYNGTQSIAAWRARQRNRMPFRAGLLAASIAAIAVVLASLFLADRSPEVAADTMTTSRAEHRATTLADGSRLELGAMTGLRVQMEVDRRLIHLDRGEAFFTVAHDTVRPFIVETALGSITAVGTAFNVVLGKDHLALTVTEGMVILRPRGTGLIGELLASEPVRAAAGQKLIVDTNSVRPRVAAESGAGGVTWPARRLEYRGEPLRTVLDDVNRYATQPVLLRDPGLGALLYTGTVELNAVDRWAEGLGGAFPVTVERSKDGPIFLSRKKLSE